MQLRRITPQSSPIPVLNAASPAICADCWRQQPHVLSSLESCVAGGPRMKGPRMLPTRHHPEPWADAHVPIDQFDREAYYVWAIVWAARAIHLALDIEEPFQSPILPNPAVSMRAIGPTRSRRGNYTPTAHEV